ncbi:hypothetical protein JST56_03300 [Candidatus Dependentiae bacterium]|jgi:hypothetical protein|nr:hypothetical protein [Candidatus Dependentiae bacterium]
MRLFFILILFFGLQSMMPTARARKNPLVLLSPHGDAKSIKKDLKPCCQPEQVHAFAHELGKQLQKKYRFSIALTHELTNTVAAWRIASLTNKFEADFFLNLNLYYQPSNKPHISLFYLTYNPLTEQTNRTFAPCSFIPVRLAHLICLQTTKRYAHLIQAMLQKPKYQKQLSIDDPIGAPLTSLAGISIPALVLEVGINAQGQWKQLIKPLVKSLVFLSNRQ